MVDVLVAAQISVEAQFSSLDTSPCCKLMLSSVQTVNRWSEFLLGNEIGVE